MVSISIFYFEGHRLVDGETVTQGDLLDAIDTAHHARANLRAEVWTDQGRMGDMGERVPTAQGTSTVSTASSSISG